MLSGAPLSERARAQLQRVHRQANGRLVLIASGGVMTAADAVARLEAGASLVQLMTGWIYRGPKLIDEIAAVLQPSAAKSLSAGSRQSPPLQQPDPARS